MAPKSSYITNAIQTPIPQSAPLTPEQVPNNAGGYSWKVSHWIQLDRWLTLGSEGGTFYVGEVDLTKANVASVKACIAEDAMRVIDQVEAVIKERRAAKIDTALYTLALCMKTAIDPIARRTAQGLVPHLHLTGYQILRLADFVQSLGGWGRGTKRAFASWFTQQRPRDLAYQAVKYQQREGWKMGDLLRLSHPIPPDELHKAIYKWIVDGEYTDFQRIVPELDPIWGYRELRVPANNPSVGYAPSIRQFRTPREAVPTELLQNPKVWDALLDDMPMVATVRNLATLTRVGVLKPLGKRTTEVAARLRDPDELRRSRIHPMALLSALTTYSQGHGVRGNATWEVLSTLIDALNDGFYRAFGNVEASGQRIILGIDCSGSMRGQMVNGIPNLEAHKAAAAMGLVLINTEPNVHTVVFGTSVQSYPLSNHQRIDDVFEAFSKINGGGTDLAQPVLYATAHNLEVDAFVILTDSESWAGNLHAMAALEQYRAKGNPNAKLVNVQMVANAVTNADPSDAGTLECVGFNTITPTVIANFLRGGSGTLVPGGDVDEDE